MRTINVSMDMIGNTQEKDKKKKEENKLEMLL